MKISFIIVCVLFACSIHSQAMDILHLKNGNKVSGKVEQITNKTVSFRMNIDLGRGKRGAVKRAVSLEKINFIEFGLLKNEATWLKETGERSSKVLRKLWDLKVPYLGQPKSNTGAVGLFLARGLLKTDSTYHWSDAMDLFDLIELKSWNEEDRKAARIGRIRGLVRQGKLEQAITRGKREVAAAKDESVMVEVEFTLGEIGFVKLKALQKKHPKWQDDDEVLLERQRIYNDSLDHYLNGSLFYATREEASARGLMGAVKLYHFAGRNDEARKCLEDVGSMYPDSSFAKQAVEQLQLYHNDKKNIIE
ncbi:MAG: hypothetical protein GXP30_14450 [Verrucomicrobia bacterium]|nr:hypothetical protein [Verrucomicrobiota bacterium]